MTLARSGSLRRKMQEDAAAPVVNKLDIAKVRKNLNMLLDLRAQVAAATLTLEGLNKEVRRLETEVLPSLFDEVGVSQMQIDDHAVSVQTEFYPGVLKADEPKFFEWLRKHHMDSIIKSELKVQFDRGEDEKASKLAATLLAKHYAVAVKQSIHPGTLKAFVREQQEKGAPLPPMLNVNPVRTVKIK